MPNPPNLAEMRRNAARRAMQPAQPAQPEVDVEAIKATLPQGWTYNSPEFQALPEEHQELIQRSITPSEGPPDNPAKPAAVPQS